MKYGFLLTFLFLITASFSQELIKLKDVSKHVGDSVKVCGRVSGILFLEQAKNTPTFINLPAGYPNQLLTVVIWSDVRKQFEKTPEELFKDKEVCVTGKIELFKEKEQIVIRAKEQIVSNK